MKKIYKIILFIIILIFLTTFNPLELNLVSKKNDELFRIKNIEIQNNQLINKNEIKKKLQNIYEKNIFFIKQKDIENPIGKMDFLEKIDVKKKYPNKIIIKVFETKPVAIIFKNKEKYLLDSSSNLISYEGKSKFDGLPNIFGENGLNWVILA